MARTRPCPECVTPGLGPQGRPCPRCAGCGLAVPCPECHGHGCALTGVVSDTGVHEVGGCPVCLATGRALTDAEFDHLLGQHLADVRGPSC